MSIEALPESPGPSNDDTINLVRCLYDEAKREHKRKVPVWNRYDRALRNRNWAADRANWLPAPQSSQIYPALHTLVAWMTDQNPTFFAAPSPDLTDFVQSPEPTLLESKADDMRVSLSSWWVNRGCQMTLSNIMWDTFMFGSGISKEGWDQTLLDGLGDCTYARVDPYTLMVDPMAGSFNDARYVIEARRVPIFEIKRRFPERAHLVHGDPAPVDEGLQRPKISGMEYVPQVNLAATGVTGPFPGTPTSGMPSRYGAAPAGSDPQDYTRSVLLIECWIRKSERLETPVIVGGKRLEDLTLDIPTWTFAAVAGGVVLNDDTANPYPHGQLPYTRYPGVEIGEFWAIPLVEHLMPAQIAINRLLAAMQSNAELTGNPILLEDDQSGISKTKIVNRPGGRLTKAPGREVRWLDPPTMPASIMELVRYWVEDIDRTSGVSSVTRGSNLRRREAASSVDAVQEASFVRIRDTLRQVEEGLRTSVTKVAANMAAFYTVPRAIAKVGPQGSDGYLTLGPDHFTYPEQQLDGRIENVPLTFDVWVEDGSSLPISRGARQAAALQLREAGAIGTGALLEAFDWPDAKKAQAEAQQEQAQAAAAEQAQGATS